MNPISKLTSLGQSLWYDNIQRKLLENGELKAMIERGEIRGVTSNPTIFNNAIAKTNDYDSALIPLAWAGWDAERIFWQLAVEDIREACDLFMPLYEETNGGDGFVSLEVSPYLANNTEATVAQAKALWERVSKPNLMIKIPATPEGIPAVRAVIAAGINVNVTLIFSLERYAEVMIAYLDGLEDRCAAGEPIDHIASVASFFVSRVDSKIDPKLPEGAPLRGKAAVANAKLAYEAFAAVFTTRRWESLKLKGARVQRPLWASTGTKNPAYPDTLYVDTLIGPETVNTVPPATLDAFRDHGAADVTLTRDLDDARSIFAQLKTIGIVMDEITDELEAEGVKAFADAFTQLLAAVDARRKTAASSLGQLADSASKLLSSPELDSVPARLWRRDPTLWATDEAGQREASNRLGWLDAPEKARALIPTYQAFAQEIHAEKIDRVLVLGMGGSSLTAEVLSSLQAGAKENAPLSLAILDSTDAQQVAETARNFPPEKSLYILASKSGGTAESMAAFHLFWKLSKGDGSRFIAITDPGTDLEKLALERGFRKIFSSDVSVGGRFSSLTDFGLVPAALLGMDLNAMLDRADWMKRECGGGTALSGAERSRSAMSAARNPGVALGAILAASARAGRDKLTILADAPVSALAGWIEQIVAESSGKNGRGILPVALEPLDAPEVYGNDRLFVYIRKTGQLDNGVAALKHAGHPVIELPMTNYADVSAEFFRWMVAIATACHLLGVNAFDQPNVQDSKTRTVAKIADCKASGKLAEKDLVETKAALPALKKFLAGVKAGDFVAINAYLPRNGETIEALQRMRVAIREQTKCAVTAGFGPRFQHSTGQFHKGGTNKGWFIQVTYETRDDVDIPTQGLSFGTLLRAQAEGDYEALLAAGRRVLRVRLGADFLREFGDLTTKLSE
ncbi:MAG: bifunctional transaldolase/phosoglucose isomerase [Chloroflexi bacterium]|nr:bifunctional transaldolase/phosoglucose isomerase [Chloroflexota bacterium]